MNELRLKDWFDLDPMDPKAFGKWLQPWHPESAARPPQIRIDVSETDQAYTVKADIPGVRKEDIDVRVDGNQVTISAEIRQDQEDKDKDSGRVLRSERHVGYASRSFALACDVDDAGAEARYADGVLELKLPKRAGSAARRLAVN